VRVGGGSSAVSGSRDGKVKYWWDVLYRLELLGGLVITLGDDLEARLGFGRPLRLEDLLGRFGLDAEDVEFLDSYPLSCLSIFAASGLGAFGTGELGACSLIGNPACLGEVPDVDAVGE